MRVPYWLVVVLCLGLMAGLWWARTKDMNFLVSRGTSDQPLPDFISTAGAGAADRMLPDPVSRPALAEEGDPAIGDPEPDPLRLGDMETAPGLAEYSELSTLGAEHLIAAAEELENRGYFQRAHLAWERILDSCEPTPEERIKASDAIQRIRPTLPRWNIDPSGEFPLLLQLGTTRREDEAIAPVATAVADFLHKESSDLVSFVPRITTSTVEGAPEQSPIAVYFSGTGDEEEKQSELSSLNPPLNDEAELRKELLTAIYALVQKRIVELDTLTPPGPAAYPDEPERDFARQITRLHWQYFARSLTRTPLQPPMPVEVAEEDLEEDGEGEQAD